MKEDNNEDNNDYMINYIITFFWESNIITYNVYLWNEIYQNLLARLYIYIIYLLFFTIFFLAIYEKYKANYDYFLNNLSITSTSNNNTYIHTYIYIYN